MMRYLLGPVALAALATPARAESRPVGGHGKAVSGISVAATVAKDTFAAGDPITLHVEVKNAGKKAVDVTSHVQANEMHFDPFRVVLYWPGPSRDGCKGQYTGRRSRVISLVGERDKSAPVTVTLEPGKTFAHDIDIGAWAAGDANKKAIAPGFYQVRVEYSHGEGKARRKAVSKVVGFTVSGTVTGDMCKANPGWRFFGP